MILDEPYDDIIRALDQEPSKIDELSDALAFVANHAVYPSYFSHKVPDVDSADLIVFITIEDRYAFLIRYKNGNSFIKEFSKEQIKEYVFTPCLLDLKTLTPVNK